jgi:hypothetical protein
MISELRVTVAAADRGKVGTVGVPLSRLPGISRSRQNSFRCDLKVGPKLEKAGPSDAGELSCGPPLAPARHRYAETLFKPEYRTVLSWKRHMYCVREHREPDS